MNYEFWSIVITCMTAAAVIWEIVFAVLSRRRAARSGVLRMKYPIWNAGTMLSMFVLTVAVLAIIISAVEIPRGLANLADYQAQLSQAPELYGRYIEKTENTIAKDRFMLSYGINTTVLSLISIFGRGAYITKDGVVFFNSAKPRKTAARIEYGSISFYTGEKHQRYAFELPETDDNKELFKGFIAPEEQRAAEG